MSLILIALFCALPLSITTINLREGLDELTFTCKELTIYNKDLSSNCEDILDDFSEQIGKINNEEESVYLLQELHAHRWSFKHIIQMEEERRKIPAKLSKETLKPLIDTDNTLLELQAK